MNFKDEAWIDSFSPQQLSVLKYVLTKADAFVREVDSNGDMDEDKRTAFIAGFYLGYDFNGGELPPEPPSDNCKIALIRKS
jgi:hypothetical protein